MNKKIPLVCLVVSLLVFSISNSVMSQLRSFALSFDGTNDYVQVPDDPSLDMIDGFTIAAWIYLEEYTEWASIVTKGGIENDGGNLTPNNYTIHQSGPGGGSDFGHLRFTGSSPALPINPCLESDTQIPLAEWHYVAITYNGTTLQFYYDGMPDGGGLLQGPLTPNDDPLHIGVDFPGGDEYWDGAIDELRIWNKALKATQIRAAMNGHSSPMAKALVGYWQFDEGYGNIARDKSKEKNHGTLLNGPTWITPGAPIGRLGKAIADQIESPVLDRFVMMANYPNPFNPATTIQYQLPVDATVEISIYNMQGQKIRSLINELASVGVHSVEWNGRDDSGTEVASGVYLYRMKAADYVMTRKLTLIR